MVQFLCNRIVHLKQRIEDINFLNGFKLVSNLKTFNYIERNFFPSPFVLELGLNARNILYVTSIILNISFLEI